MLCCGWCWPGFPGAGCWSRWPLASSCSGGPGPRDAKSMRVWRSRPTSSGSMSRYRPRRVSTGSLRSFSGVWWSQSTWESRYRHCADAGVLLFAVVVLAAGGDVVLEAAQPVPVLAEPLHEVADGARLLAAVRRAGPGWVSRAVGWAACAWALAPCCCSLRFRGLARPQHAPVGPQRPGFGVFARLGSPNTSGGETGASGCVPRPRGVPAAGRAGRGRHTSGGDDRRRTPAPYRVGSRPQMYAPRASQWPRTGPERHQGRKPCPGPENARKRRPWAAERRLKHPLIDRPASSRASRPRLPG